MPNYFGALTIVLLFGMVMARAMMMRRQGKDVMHFGNIDRTDFLIPLFALFYVYLVFAAAFDWPLPGSREFFQSEFISWVGALLCLAGLALVAWSLVSFGQSFRIGIDTEHPDQLITTGAFAVSRNPIYLAFGLILLGQFLIFSNWILLVYLLAGVWLFNRQVLREEEYLKKHYGQEYLEYCNRVRRYI